MNRKQRLPETPDRLMQCVMAEGMLRVALIDGTNLVDEARRIHGLSRVATAAMGRQLMMTAVMAADLKHEDDLVSTIIKGDGIAGSLICTGNAALEMKGSVPDGESELPPTPEGKLDVGGYIGHSGKLTVVSDLGLKEPYVGVCNLVSGEIAVDFANYYAASLQRPALVYLGVRLDAESGEVLAAGGVFAEPLPGCPDETIDRLQAKSERIVTLSERLSKGETLDAFLADVLGEFSPQILLERTPVYRCDCSRERVERALISVGGAEIRDMAESDHGAEVKCRFCDKSYAFTERELLALLYSENEEEEPDETKKNGAPTRAGEPLDKEDDAED